MRFFAWKENFAKADALIVENRPLPISCAGCWLPAGSRIPHQQKPF